MIKESLAKLVQGESLSENEMMDVMDRVMEGEVTPTQLGGFLTALRLKGETVDELTGGARVMREKSVKVRFRAPLIMDTCGTGGDGSNTFNISTTVAFILAAAGIPMAKHGNRAMSSRCGSADVLEALGIKVDLPPERVAQCLETAGIGFMYAPVYHHSMKHAAGPRRELGFRTVFNMLGPLTNPAGANCQLIGVYHPDLTVLFARVLQRLGSHRVMVVHGSGGMDELSLEGANQVSVLRDDRIHTFTVTASDVGLKPAANRELQGGDARDNAAIIESILTRSETGPKRDAVLLNAAAGLFISGKAEDLQSGVTLARQLIEDGLAFGKLTELRRLAG